MNKEQKDPSEDTIWTKIMKYQQNIDLKNQQTVSKHRPRDAVATPVSEKQTEGAVATPVSENQTEGPRDGGVHKPTPGLRDGGVHKPTPVGSSEQQTEEGDSEDDSEDSEDCDELEDDTQYTSPFSMKREQVQVDRWVASWYLSDEQSLSVPTWIDVYAHYCKKTRCGGYGVILRSVSKRPIIASAKFSKVGNSFLYQVFMGINAGVALAEGLGRSGLQVRCNSLKVAFILRHLRACDNKICEPKHDPTKYCMNCKKFLKVVRCGSRLVLPVIMELRGKKLELSGARGVAAHYVAKLGKELAEEKCIEENDGSGEFEIEIEPHSFPPGLRYLLWKDAFCKSDFNVR